MCALGLRIIADVDEDEAPMKDSKKESKKDKDKSNQELTPWLSSTLHIKKFGRVNHSLHHSRYLSVKFCHVFLLSFSILAAHRCASGFLL
jgi:hypothetical protein